MIAALRSIRPWVWLGSGLRFRVQFTKMAFRPSKRGDRSWKPLSNRGVRSYTPDQTSRPSGQRRSLSRTLRISGAGIGGRWSPTTTPNRPSATSWRPPPPSGRRGDLRLPLLAEADDLVVAAADEVPPHDDGLAERAPPRSSTRDRLLAGRDRSRRAGPGGGRRARSALGLRAGDADRAGVDEDAVLVGRVHGERAATAPGSSTSSAPSSGGDVATGEVAAEQRPEEDPRRAAVAGRPRRSRSARSRAVCRRRPAGRPTAGRRAAWSVAAATPPSG